MEFLVLRRALLVANNPAKNYSFIVQSRTVLLTQFVYTSESLFIKYLVIIINMEPQPQKKISVKIKFPFQYPYDFKIVQLHSNFTVQETISYVILSLGLGA